MSAALNVFARRGFANTKIGDIASRAGVSHGLVYHYFISKEEIFGEFLKFALEGSSQSFLAAQNMAAPPVEKIRWFSQTMLQSISSYEDSSYYFMIVIHAALMESSDENRAFAESPATSLKSLVDIITEGQKAGEFREGDPFGMALTFSADIQGLAVYKLTVKEMTMPDPEILVNMLKKK